MWRSNNSAASVKEGTCASRNWASPCFNAVRTSVIFLQFSQITAGETNHRKYNAETPRPVGQAPCAEFHEKTFVGQGFLPVRVRSAKSQRDRQECLSYSRGGEFLLEA